MTNANPKPGEMMETAIWLSGRETRQHLEQFAQDVHEALNAAAGAAGVVIADPHAVVKYPGDERVPPVPDHISGPDVRLLVIEALVIGFAKGDQANFIANELEPDDLDRLRRATRRAYERMMKSHGHKAPPRLTDRQCDTIINDLGPEVALESLSKGETSPLDVERTLH